MDKHQNFRHSLCWDCKNAVTLGCSWADRFEPVPGWTAEATKKKTFGVLVDSYRVEACPEFIRDAENFGLKRMKKKGGTDDEI